MTNALLLNELQTFKGIIWDMLQTLILIFHFLLLNFFFFFEFIDSNKQAVIYKAKALKQIQINSKGQP